MFSENENLVPKVVDEPNGYIYTVDKYYTQGIDKLLAKHPYMIELVFGYTGNVPKEFDCLFMHFKDHAVNQTMFEILSIEEIVENKIIDSYEKNLVVKIAVTEEVFKIIDYEGFFECNVFVLRVSPNINKTVKPTIFCNVQ